MSLNMLELIRVMSGFVLYQTDLWSRTQETHAILAAKHASPGQPELSVWIQRKKREVGRAGQAVVAE